MMTSSPILVLLVGTLLLCKVLPAIATATTPRVVNTTLIPTYRLCADFSVTNGSSSSRCLGGAELTWARYNRSFLDIGWDYLEVNFPTPASGSAEALDDSYRYAGFLEAFLTWDSMPVPPPITDPDVQTWMNEHFSYMQANSNNPTSEFWLQVGNWMAMLEGMAQGYNAAIAKNSSSTRKNFTTFDMYLVNYINEIGNIQDLVNVRRANIPPGTILRGRRSHCSAMVRPTKDNLYVTHTTWDLYGGYGGGLQRRFYKIYRLVVGGSAMVTTQTTIVQSGYSGLIANGDDWYQTSQQLAIQETSTGFMNSTLFDFIVPNAASEFLRVMVATARATSGEEWTRYFSMNNSGTYNNQYMVVDFKLYAPGSSLVPGTLWIAEQIPGFVQRGDVTDVLAKQGYWASYNIPYYSYIYNVSGFEQKYQEEGNFWSYSKYARAEIFRRNATSVQTLEHVMRLQRYNDYLHDPLSLISNCSGTINGDCSPQRHSSINAIAARGDLEHKYATANESLRHYGPVTDVGPYCGGGYDTKIATWTNRHSLASYFVNGPTNDQQPTFKWGENDICPKSMQPPGTPSEYDFPWVTFSPAVLGRSG